MLFGNTYYSTTQDFLDPLVGNISFVLVGSVYFFLYEMMDTSNAYQNNFNGRYHYVYWYEILSKLSILKPLKQLNEFFKIYKSRPLGMKNFARKLWLYRRKCCAHPKQKGGRWINPDKNFPIASIFVLVEWSIRFFHYQKFISTCVQCI